MCDANLNTILCTSFDALGEGKKIGKKFRGVTTVRFVLNPDRKTSCNSSLFRREVSELNERLVFLNSLQAFGCECCPSWIRQHHGPKDHELYEGVRMTCFTRNAPSTVCSDGRSTTVEPGTTTLPFVLPYSAKIGVGTGAVVLMGVFLLLTLFAIGKSKFKLSNPQNAK